MTRAVVASLCRSALGLSSGGWGVALAVALLAPQAWASSPDAWRAYDREVRTACLKASRLFQPRALGERLDVPVADVSPEGHTALISALLIEGRDPQASLQSRKRRELCLFEQRTRRATLSDAEFLDRPRPKP